jgi:hypothetical protein
VAELVRERHGVAVEMTPSRRSGEFAVLVDGRCVVRKRLPLVRPGDERVLAAVAAALAR